MSGSVDVFIMLLYMAVLNLIGLTTYSVGTCAGAVFTITCTIVFGGALMNSNYYTISHYAPEFEESKSAWLVSYGDSAPSDVYTYVMMSRSGALYWLLNLRVFAGFIAAIELLGVGVRAVSLSLRLIANLSCGHILLTLYSDNLVSGFKLNALDGYNGFVKVMGHFFNVALRNTRNHGSVPPTLLHLFIAIFSLAVVAFYLSGVEAESVSDLLARVLVVLFLFSYGAPALILFCRLLLRVLETVVAIVQAYVFLTLATSYLQ